MRRVRGRGILLVFVILFVVLCFAAYTKQGMMTMVKFFEDPLTSYAETTLSEGGNADYLGRKYVGFGYYMDVCPSSGCLFFVHHSFGETGFFYSSSGEPVGYQGTDAIFKKQGDGWFWQEEHGKGNWMYAEHIVGNWYWYEAHL